MMKETKTFLQCCLEGTMEPSEIHDAVEAYLGDSYEYGQIVRRDQPDVIDYHMVTIWRNGDAADEQKGMTCYEEMD